MDFDFSGRTALFSRALPVANTLAPWAELSMWPGHMAAMPPTQWHLHAMALPGNMGAIGLFEVTHYFMPTQRDEDVTCRLSFICTERPTQAQQTQMQQLASHLKENVAWLPSGVGGKY